MTLLDELNTGPLAAEIAPHITSGNDVAIADILNRRDISVYSKVSVGVLADWLAVTGLRTAVEDHAANTSSPLRANALSILDLLRGSHDYMLDFGEAPKQALLQAWVTNGSIIDSQRISILDKSKTLLSRAEQAGITATAQAVAAALGRP